MKLLTNIMACVAGIALSAMLAGCRGPKLATADQQMARGEYFEAAATYRKVYNKLTKPRERPLRGEVAFKMGEADRKLSRYARAAADYRNAMRYGYPDSTAQLLMARMLHADGKYPAAIEAYEQYLMRAPGNREALEGLRGARMATEMKKKPSRYLVRQSKLLNSRRSDFSPVFAGPDRLYFSSTNEKVTGQTRSEVTGTKRSDIWTVGKDEQGRWLRPEPAKGEINTDADEGAVAISPDGQKMYVTRARKSETADAPTEIWVSHRSDAAWSEAQRLDIITDTIHSYAHPTLSADGRWLYFTSDRPGGFGDLDLWRIRLDAPDPQPENLGAAINTPGREMFPTLRSDSLLYFSSDGHAGMGGLDIFRAALSESGGWSITSMGSPVNSEGDDFGITFEPGREAGFFSSNRGDARGYDHIYSFELPELKITISGYVTDLEEEPIAGALIRIVGRDGSNRRTATRDDGSFSFPLERGVSYVMLAGAKGYLNARQEFTADDAEEDADYQVDFALASLTEPNVVENIFYDFDKATLRAESAEALDGLVKMLKENPDVTVEMSSHTDRVGTDDYNMRLSDRRAKSVVDYLVNAGISPDRLTWKGYGKSRPKTVTRRVARQYPQFAEGTVLDADYVGTLPEADREAADQINRRTEFLVTGTNIR